jgi:phosphoribosyl 1,2-cyclic phosphodiesterase
VQRRQAGARIQRSGDARPAIFPGETRGRSLARASLWPKSEVLMQVRFLGVRGSVATPGPATVRTGGNTSSVEVLCGAQRIVLDAGTGLRVLGDELAKGGETELTLLLSHLHWDHVQGLPFFAPLYRASTRLAIHGLGAAADELTRALSAQMSSPGFPVRWQELPSRLSCTPLLGGESFLVGDVRVTCARLNHPGGVLAYRLEHDGSSVVYATDTEHYACDDPKLLALARDADVLIYDAMYTEPEYRGELGPARVGWGHSTWEAGVRIARRAGAKKLVLFHHDPGRDDQAVDGLEQAAQAHFPNTVAAREGACITLGADGEKRAA